MSYEFGKLRGVALEELGFDMSFVGSKTPDRIGSGHVPKVEPNAESGSVGTQLAFKTLAVVWGGDGAISKRFVLTLSFQLKFSHY